MSARSMISRRKYRLLRLVKRRVLTQAEADLLLQIYAIKRLRIKKSKFEWD